MPAFSPIEECTEHEDFIAGFEKFNEDVKGYLISTDKKFTNLTNRRLSGRSNLRETAAALRRKAEQQAQSPLKIDLKVEQKEDKREFELIKIEQASGTSSRGNNSPNRSFVTCVSHI